MNTTPVLCECNSLNCALSINLPLGTAMEILQEGQAVIIDGCKVGPKHTDTFIEKREGYSLYKIDLEE